jgi:hypothetical protein
MLQRLFARLIQTRNGKSHCLTQLARFLRRDVSSKLFCLNRALSGTLCFQSTRVRLSQSHRYVSSGRPIIGHVIIMREQNWM